MSLLVNTGKLLKYVSFENDIVNLSIIENSLGTELVLNALYDSPIKLVNNNITHIRITDYIYSGSSGCSADVGPREIPEVNHIEIGHKDCLTVPGQIAHELMHSLEGYFFLG